MQLSAFMSMNKDRHVNAFKDYYQHLVDDEFDKAEVTRTFYEEYMAVADLLGRVLPGDRATWCSRSTRCPRAS